MIGEFKQIAASLTNKYVSDWKAKGKSVIGYPCTFIPDEIIHAAGMLPFRMRGVGTSSLSIGDTYFGPVICSYPKCILQLAGQGDYRFLDGAVILNGCDSMRRLDECWRKAGIDYQGILPSYFHYFGVPHKVTDYSIAWFEDELKAFMKSIEDHFKVEITETALRKSIGLYNVARRLLIELDEMRSGDTTPVSGEEAAAIILAGFAIPREIYNELLSETIHALKNNPSCSVTDGKKRIMVVGSTSDDLDFIRLIEESGCIVVADTMCFGSRSYSDLADEQADPVSSLARHYLSHKFCPRMFGYYKERLSFMIEKALQARVDGVILQNIRFCDLHGSENGIFERDLEAQGVPCMRMEREYGPLVETGRIKMRVDAFMERIA
ncbi:MAG TPA: 2-hydroxyacyl-CoA dehydratase family protein [Desulfomonilia bacterium]|nr:2-hydroxyacyl-CoA dehydratase family protein [Desulfomonilia bacterium]